MSSYLERLKKISILPSADKTDKTDKSSSIAGDVDSPPKKYETSLSGTDKTDKSLSGPTFGSFGSFGSSGNEEIFFRKDSHANPSVSFGSAPPRESDLFSSVRCSDCQHALPATATDPHSWHSCDRGLKGWWGMAPHRCERWDGKAERIAKEEEARLAEEERQRRKKERQREEIEKNIRLTLFSSFNDLVTGASVWAGLELTQERIKALIDPRFEQERMQWPALQKFDRKAIQKAIDGLKAILEVYQP